MLLAAERVVGGGGGGAEQRHRQSRPGSDTADTQPPTSLSLVGQAASRLLIGQMGAVGELGGPWLTGRGRGGALAPHLPPDPRTWSREEVIIIAG